MSGEFVGTVLFLYFALSGAQVANSIKSSAGLTVEETGANPQQLQYIALSFGFSLAVNAWVFFRISGGLFNPAVTVGMCLIGALPWFRGSLLFVVQVLGGIVAAALVSCMFPGDLNVETDLGGDTTVVQGLFIEMMLTAQLVFTIFMLAAEKHKGTFIAPIGIGLSLFVAELTGKLRRSHEMCSLLILLVDTGVYFTGGSLNPARSFGPAVVNHNFETYHWIYWVGPLLGAFLSAGFFKFIKMLEYETANPDQDATLEDMRNIAQATNGHDHSVAHHHWLEHEEKAVDGDQVNTSGTTTATQPPVMMRRPTQPRMPSERVASDSPAMGTTDDAYHGLAHGMHGTEDTVSSRVHQRSVQRTPSGIV